MENKYNFVEKLENFIDKHSLFILGVICMIVNDANPVYLAVLAFFIYYVD